MSVQLTFRELDLPSLLVPPVVEELLKLVEATIQMHVRGHCTTMVLSVQRGQKPCVPRVVDKTAFLIWDNSHGVVVKMKPSHGIKIVDVGYIMPDLKKNPATRDETVSRHTQCQ